MFLLAAAILVAASMGGGAARAHDLRMIEICAGDSVTIIHVDAEGRQVPAAPVCGCDACKHCGASAIAVLPSAPATASTPRLMHPVATLYRAFDLTRREWSLRQARGPPAPKAMT